MDLSISFLHQGLDCLVCDRIELSTDILGIYFEHHLVNQKLGLLILLPFVSDLDLFLLLLFLSLLIHGFEPGVKFINFGGVQRINLLLFSLVRHLFLECWLILFLFRMQDIQLGDRGNIQIFLRFWSIRDCFFFLAVDGHKGGEDFLFLEVHLILINYNIKVTHNKTYSSEAISNHHNLPGKSFRVIFAIDITHPI